MMLFDVTLIGYDGSTDKTDHLVKWVKVPNLEILKEWLSFMSLSYAVESITEIKNCNHYSYEDGVDIIITEDFKLDSWHRQVIERLGY